MECCHNAVSSERDSWEKGGDCAKFNHPSLGQQLNVHYVGTPFIYINCGAFKQIVFGLSNLKCLHDDIKHCAYLSIHCVFYQTSCISTCQFIYRLCHCFSKSSGRHTSRKFVSFLCRFSYIYFHVTPSYSIFHPSYLALALLQSLLS